MRPPGEIRQAARKAAWEAAEASARGVVTWRDVSSRLVPQGIGQAAAKFAVKNMARSGELVPAPGPEGWARVPGVSRPLRAYMPASAQASTSALDALSALDMAFRGGLAMR